MTKSSMWMLTYLKDKYHEGTRLTYTDRKKELFLVRSHQSDWRNYTFWKWSHFLVCVLWIPLKFKVITDRTSTRKTTNNYLK
jgi:hypothetical protein